MSNTEEVVNTCDWCLQEARVQTIDQKLWLFWKIISTEDPMVTSHKNICDKCKSRYEGFSIYIERCKINTSKTDELLSTRQVKEEPSIDIEYPPLVKKEISNEVDSNSYCVAVSSGVFNERSLPTNAGCSNFPTKNDSTSERVLLAGTVKKERSEEDFWKEASSCPDYLTTSGSKEKANRSVLRVISDSQVLPDSRVRQKKVNTLICTYCDKTFIFPSKLKIHLCSHTGDKPFKCSHCSKSFSILNTLNRHLRIHTAEKPFTCSHCNKSFTQVTSLNCHLRIHTGDKPFECSQCNKSFTWLSSLNLHLRIHTGDRRFTCSHCNKSFNFLSSLNRHLRIHTGKKPFTCSHCDKSFIVLSKLNHHLLTHTGDKPLKCLHCNKSFTRSSHLKVHLRIHTGGKPFKCSHCNKSFTQSNHLKVHLRIHTGDKPFKCSHCNKSFAQSNGLKYHLRLHTNDK